MDTLRRKPLLKGYVTAVLVAALAIVVTGCGGGGGGGDNGSQPQQLPASATLNGKLTDSVTSIALSNRWVVVTSGTFTTSVSTGTDGSFSLANIPTDNTVVVAFSESQTTASNPFWTGNLQSQSYSVSGNTVTANFNIPYSNNPPGPVF